jgi:NO-binding membrane sensor protein with MHYT domain
MPVVHHFAYGPVNPTLAYAMAFLGSLLGLTCTAYARAATTSGRRSRWLLIASFSIGGGIWLMHFMAMLGFDIPATQVRYNVPLTVSSAALAIGVVGVGLLIVSSGRRAVWKILLGGVFTGTGVATMHYTGMAAMRIAGGISYDTSIVAASVLIAVVAATVALALAVTVRGRLPIVFSAAIMGVAVCGMHYCAMAALRIHLNTDGRIVPGMDPIVLVLPIIVIVAGGLIAMMFGALQTANEEDSVLSQDLAFLVRTRGEPHPVTLLDFERAAVVPVASAVSGHAGRRR